MSDTPIPRRCRWGFHRWGAWRDIQVWWQNAVNGQPVGEPYLGTQQERQCADCKRRERRTP